MSFKISSITQKKPQIFSGTTTFPILAPGLSAPITITFPAFADIPIVTATPRVATASLLVRIGTVTRTSAQLLIENVGVATTGTTLVSYQLCGIPL